MKKKCTNSACRRAFTPVMEQGQVRCPHCGKVYPRLEGAAEAAGAVTLRLTSILPGVRKLDVIKRLHLATGMPLLDARHIVDKLDTEPFPIPLDMTLPLKPQLAQWRAICSVEGTVPPEPRKFVSPDERYRILVTGYDPRFTNMAVLLLRSACRSTRSSCLKALETLPRQKLVLVRDLTHDQAMVLVEKALKYGVTLELLREKRTNKRALPDT